jgi:GH25 family lysozyme M1 (1,4-beta-N-acetylmuramidase)
VSGAQVRLQASGVDSTKAATFINSTQLQVSATFGNDPSTWTAQVINPSGATSGTFSFAVNAPMPVITSLSPSSASAGGAAFTLTVNGDTFDHASVVRWNGANRTTTLILSPSGQLVTGLQASISAADIASAGTAQVTVYSPGSGGGTSSAASFTMVATRLLAPTLTLPSDGAMNVPTTTGFSWSNVIGNHGYRIIVSTSYADMTTDPTSEGNPSPAGGFNVNLTTYDQTSYAPTSALSAGTKYYWEVHAKAGTLDQAGYWSQGSFTTAVIGTQYMGIDVSHWQGTIDWSKVLAEGDKIFAYIKASQGINYSAYVPYFDTNAALAQGVGIVVGAYHFAAPDQVPNDPTDLHNDAVSEAHYFVQVASSYLKSINLQPMLDLEDGNLNDGGGCGGLASAGDWAQIAQWTTDWAAEVRQEVSSSLTPILYMTRDYASHLLGVSPSLTSYRLWIADPGDPSSSPMPYGNWTPTAWPWSIWQYYGAPTGGSANVPGIQFATDLDILNPTTTLSILEIGQPTTQYDRQSAVAYALKYANYVTSDGYFWEQSYPPTYIGALTPVPSDGVDCAHFVSSAIGDEAHEQGGGLIVPNATGTNAYGNPSASGLMNWLLNSGNAVTEASVNDLSPGDVIAYDWQSDGSIDHVALYLGNGDIAAHSVSYSGVSWDIYKSNSSLGPFIDGKWAQFIHIVGAATNLPIIQMLDPEPRSLVYGTPLTINYTVSDTGGPGLQQVELWRAPDDGGVPGDWGNQAIMVNPASGTASVSGSFLDVPPPGVWWYGIHVKDINGNYRTEQQCGLNPISVVVAADTTPPTVTKVLVRGSTWTSSFPDYLGYSIPVGRGSQLLTLPWTNIDQIKVVFSENVAVAKSDLALSGVNTTTYNVSGGTFTYDSGSCTATWTLPQAIGADMLMIRLYSTGSNAIKDIAGNALDGEWTNPTSTTQSSSSNYPSGNGTAGGDFLFRFNVLPGDVSQDGMVISNDVVKVRNKLGTTTTDSAYSILMDVNGDGMIISNDLVKVRNQLGMQLPEGELVVPSDMLAAITSLSPLAAEQIMPIEATPSLIGTSDSNLVALLNSVMAQASSSVVLAMASPLAVLKMDDLQSNIYIANTPALSTEPPFASTNVLSPWILYPFAVDQAISDLNHSKLQTPRQVARSINISPSTAANFRALEEKPSELLQPHLVQQVLKDTQKTKTIRIADKLSPYYNRRKTEPTNSIETWNESLTQISQELEDSFTDTEMFLAEPGFHFRKESRHDISI